MFVKFYQMMSILKFYASIVTGNQALIITQGFLFVLKVKENILCQFHFYVLVSVFSLYFRKKCVFIV